MTWITDRRPTAADADAYGEVLAELPSQLEPGTTWSAYVAWDSERITDGTPWRRTMLWATPTQLGEGWQQLEPLPAREVG